jgi:hypothetical protein
LRAARSAAAFSSACRLASLQMWQMSNIQHRLTHQNMAGLSGSFPTIHSNTGHTESGRRCGVNPALGWWL